MQNPRRIIEIQIKALEEMQNEFTSHLFNKITEKYGMTMFEIKLDINYRFLKKYCNHLSRYIWQIKPKSNNNLLKNSYIAAGSQTDEIIEAIILLKSTGIYRVSKRNDDWVDL